MAYIMGDVSPTIQVISLSISIVHIFMASLGNYFRELFISKHIELLVLSPIRINSVQNKLQILELTNISAENESID